MTNANAIVHKIKFCNLITVVNTERCSPLNGSTIAVTQNAIHS